MFPVVIFSRPASSQVVSVRGPLASSGGWITFTSRWLASYCQSVRFPFGSIYAANKLARKEVRPLIAPNNGTLRFVLLASGSYYSPLHDRKRGDSKNEQQYNTNNANDQTSVSP
jgi:hypothetical protein